VRCNHLILAVAVGLLPLPAVHAAAQATVFLHEQALVPDGTIALGQLADISADEETARELAAVEIGYSPLPGRRRSISAGYVRMRMARAGFDAKGVTLTGAPAVTVCHQAPPTMAQDTPSSRQTATEPDDLAAGPIVLRRGQNVEIVVISGGFVVSTTGQLLGDAAVGESALARVTTTGQKVCGMLTASRQITIRL